MSPTRSFLANLALFIGAVFGALLFFSDSLGITSTWWKDFVALMTTLASCAYLVLTFVRTPWLYTAKPNDEHNPLGKIVPRTERDLALRAMMVTRRACDEQSGHEPFTFELLIAPPGTTKEACDEFLAEIPKSVRTANRFFAPGTSPHGQFVLWQTPKPEELGDLPNAIDRLTANGAAHHIGGRDVVDAYWWVKAKLDSYNV